MSAKTSTDAMRTARADAAIPALPDDPMPTHRLSLARIAAAARAIAPALRDSPQFASPALDDALGLSVTLKVETLNPLRSFKGRGADWLLHDWPGAPPRVDHDAPATVTPASAGIQRLSASTAATPLRAVACASAGNFGQALAFAARARGIACTVFAATGANSLKLDRMRALGADVRLAGDDFDAAKIHARAWADAHAVTYIEDGRERAISEGAGTIALEMTRDAAVPFDAVVIPLGNGALAAGMARWLRAAWPSTRVVAVCARGADVMARALRAPADAPLPFDSRCDTIADGIAVRVPVPEAVADLRGLLDDIVRVDDDAIVTAMRALHRHAGLVVEPAGAAGIAALVQHRARFAGQRVATVLCGGNVTPAQARAWRLCDD